MNKKIITQISGLLVLFISLLISGCGNDSRLDQFGSISISPISFETTTADTGGASTCLGLSNVAVGYRELVFTISALDADTTPVGGVDLFIQLEWQGNNWNGIEVLAMYDDENGNGDGVADPAEKVTNVGDAVEYRTTTNPDGTKKIIVRKEIVSLGDCLFSGNFLVTSGAVSNSAVVEVKG